VLSRLREVCLAWPETSETASWGHPNFRAGTKVFAAYEHVGGRPSIAIKVAARDAARLLAQPQFFSTPYGRGQWVSTWIDGPIDWRLLTTLLEKSYRSVALKRMIAALEGPASGTGPRTRARIHPRIR
jgi:predicted DNA-binding protein (MmcQ/YjbR family)